MEAVCTWRHKRQRQVKLQSGIYIISMLRSVQCIPMNERSENRKEFLQISLYTRISLQKYFIYKFSKIKTPLNSANINRFPVLTCNPWISDIPATTTCLV